MLPEHSGRSGAVFMGSDVGLGRGPVSHPAASVRLGKPRGGRSHSYEGHMPSEREDQTGLPVCRVGCSAASSKCLCCYTLAAEIAGLTGSPRLNGPGSLHPISRSWYPQSTH